MTEIHNTANTGNHIEALDARGRASLAILAPNPAVLCASGATGSQKTVTKRAALTDSIIGELPEVDIAEIPVIFERAREAGARWAGVGYAERKRVILRFVDEAFAHRDELLDLVQWENGKARSSAFEEFYDVIMNSRYYANNAQKILRTRRVPGAVIGLTQTQVHHVPKGVVGIISPWNYPLAMGFSDAVAALMAGNAVVLKPDSLTPYTALAVRSLLLKAGLPEDVFQVVIGSGAKLGDPMIANANYMMFTGSTATGRIIAEKAGRNLIGFSAELGGKNGMIVRADAPVKRAARGVAKASFASSGQLCISMERIYIHEDIWDEFVPEFVKVTEDLQLAVTYDWDNDMGPLISDAQVAKITEHLEDAKAKGAKVLAGGYFDTAIAKRAFRPTVLTDVTPEMLIYSEETFGPMVSLYKVSSDDEAVSLINSLNYGLNGGIWSGDLKVARELAKRFHTGTVNINDGYAAAWGSIHAPSGGFKDSGMSHRHGPEGIIKYTDVQTVATQRLMHIAAPEQVGEKLWATALTAYLKVQHKLHI
ncbi:MAG: succinic semialdehyde dehydrogenase [Arcanobacterium sp.]|nr:succinic semialdehyde dehydrogenase [Arcanobacterium sp.]